MKPWTMVDFKQKSSTNLLLVLILNLINDELSLYANEIIIKRLL